MDSMDEVYELARRDKPAGWSKRIYAQDPNDPDVRATAIADKFHDMMVDYMIRQFGVARFYGVELNWNTAGELSEMYVRHIDRMVKDDPAAADIIDRIYEDQLSVEVCTAPATPRSAIERVNYIKQAAFEGSQLYNKESKNLWARKLRKSIRPHYVSFFPSRQYANQGEHLNVSVAYVDPDRSDYDYMRMESPKTGDTLLARNNLLGEKRLYDSRFSHWNEIFHNTLEVLLSHDTILAIGNRFSLHPEIPVEGPLEVIPDEDSDLSDYDNIHQLRQREKNREIRKQYGKRVEIRSFHDATSNISLSSLATTSILFAALLTGRDQQVIDRQLQIRSQPSLIQKEEILAEMESSFHFNKLMPKSFQEAEERFAEHSVTLRMMRFLAKECALDAEQEASLLAEIDEFRDICISRAQQLCEEPWAGKAHAERIKRDGKGEKTPGSDDDQSPNSR